MAGKAAVHRFDGRSKSLLVSFRASARRWTLGARLAEWEIAAEDGESRCAEGFGESDQQRSIAVCSGAVGQYQAIAAALRGLVEETANGDSVGSVLELPKAFHTTM
jgi:hypothetical protein